MQYTQVIKLVFPKVWENSHACKYKLHLKKKKNKEEEEEEEKNRSSNCLVLLEIPD